MNLLNIRDIEICRNQFLTIKMNKRIKIKMLQGIVLVVWYRLASYLKLTHHPSCCVTLRPTIKLVHFWRIAHLKSSFSKDMEQQRYIKQLIMSLYKKRKSQTIIQPPFYQKQTTQKMSHLSLCIKISSYRKRKCSSKNRNHYSSLHGHSTNMLIKS